MSKPNYAYDFGSFDGRIWLNCAHQGPLPRAAEEAAEKALHWKISPYHLHEDAFFSIPQKLKGNLGRLINISPEEIILGNSTSYGIHLLANGLPLEAGDEVLLVEGDFPANILPWLTLEKRGVKVRLLNPEGEIPTPEEIAKGIAASTKVFCTSWVNSFNGYAIDIHGIGKICRERGVIFVVNGSQALGAKTLDLSSAPIDAFTCCGFKWLCGPYGTGFCWIKPEILETLEYRQAYWLAMQQGRSLNKMREYKLRDDLGASAYDVFCTANFMNFMPWTASIEYFIQQGPDEIEKYDKALVSYLIKHLDCEKYELLSSETDSQSSTLVFISHKESNRNTFIYEKLQQKKIHISLRKGNLRISPHLYNTTDEIDQLLSALASV